jgi:hypothetical protein
MIEEHENVGKRKKRPIWVSIVKVLLVLCAAALLFILLLLGSCLLMFRH